MADLVEAGRVISATNEKRLRQAIKTVEEVLASIGETEAEVAASEAATQAAGGQDYPASDFAYVPDPEKSSTWKLRLTKTPGGGPDSGLVGAACAALGPGFRGNKVEIPAADLPAVKAKVRAAWKKANPDRDLDEMPAVIKESEGQDGTEVDFDFVPLVEKAVYADGTMPIKIIRPGWGSSGYYKPETLMRDGPKVFTKGTQMFADHQTAAEESERPEGSVHNLVAEFVNDAYYDSVGPMGLDGKLAGPGLYANAKVFEHWRPFVQDLGPHIGLSIRAMGRASHGEAEGREGPIIEGIVARKSVDLVTAPGAGGQILNLFESARTATQTRSGGTEDMAEEKALQDAVAAKEAAETKLTEAETALAEATTKSEAAEAENARLREGEILLESTTFVTGSLPEDLPELTKARLIESLKRAPVVKEGKIDKEEFKKVIDDAVKVEVEYLAKITESGTVRGMGPAASKDAKVDLIETWKGHFLAEGKDEETATKLAELAASGR